MRKKIVAGNWKMNKNPAESEALAREVAARWKDFPAKDKAEAVVCPTFLALDRVASVLRGTGVSLGAQDVHWEGQGAYTGKVSADMLKSLGVEYVIVGHSEQRTYFHETDATVNRKARKVLAEGMVPIICVGETLEEREAGKTGAVVDGQVRGAFQGISAADARRCVVAYEPVWAIGTGRNATDDQAQEVHARIRSLLAQILGAEVSQAIRIQYGGSMKPENAKGLLAQPDIDGGLIGGASLKADSFLGILSSV